MVRVILFSRNKWIRGNFPIQKINIIEHSKDNNNYQHTLDTKLEAVNRKSTYVELRQSTNTQTSPLIK